MKNSIIILIIAVATFVVFQSFMAASTKNIEKQPYRVVKKEKEFEIRYYPSATMATIKSKATTYRELSGSGFRQIAGYIFGGNESSTKIAMTSPVHMEINKEGSSMSFVMPSEYNLSTLPRPNDSQVELHASKPEYVAAIEFGGYVNDATLKKYTETLANSLKKYNIEIIGHFRYLGYNPPYQFFNRRNEIIVEVAAVYI
jgi:SOUL heme-binding protein